MPDSLLPQQQRQRRVRLSDEPTPQPQPQTGIEHNGGPPMGDNGVRGDLLYGCHEIAAFVFGDCTPINVKRIYRLTEDGTIPAGRLGGKLVASRKKLRQFLDDATG